MVKFPDLLSKPIQLPFARLELLYTEIRDSAPLREARD